MTYRGTVKNGVIVLEKGLSLPEGTDVQVLTTSQQRQEQSPKASPLGQTLLRHAGKAKGLPVDAARNHDHYLYGTPKR